MAFTGSEDSLVQLGRISGKLLKDNLTRNGINLAFETDLLYLDVVNKRIGVTTATPTHDLHVNGTTHTTNLIVDGTSAKIGNVIFNTDGSISTQVGTLHIVPTGDETIVIEHDRVITDTLDINDNYIAGLVPGRNIELRPNGSGITNISANSYVNGDVAVTGSIFANTDVNIKGILTIGDTIFDTVTVVPDFSQSIIPGDNNLYDLGTDIKRWRNLYIQDNAIIPEFISSTVTVSNQMYIAGNSITSLQSNDDLFLTSNEGTVTLEKISFKDDTITNLLDSAIRISSTGNGYLQFAGSFGILIPAGTTEERVGNAVGDTRWNTDLDYMECFDGTVWQVATGGGATVTQELMEDFGHRYTLIFG